MKNKLKEILNQLNDIEYGYVDKNQNIHSDDVKNWDSNFGNKYRLQSPEELIKNKYGLCWDQVELERYYLEQKNIESKSYFIIAYDGNHEQTHTFIVVKEDKYYWLEHSWQPYRGIHEYNSLSDLLNDVKTEFEKSVELQNIKDYDLVIYEYSKPKFNLNCTEFMEHCAKGTNINI